MDRIEQLMSDYPDIEFSFDKLMPLDLGGYTVGNRITINDRLSESEQYQWLFEELGHYQTSVGDISDYGDVENAKQEHLARNWGYKHFLSEKDIKRLKSNHPENDYEVADDLGMQLNYLHEIGFTYGLHFKHASD